MSLNLGDVTFNTSTERQHKTGNCFTTFILNIHARNFCKTVLIESRANVSPKILVNLFADVFLMLELVTCFLFSHQLHFIFISTFYMLPNSERSNKNGTTAIFKISLHLAAACVEGLSYVPG